MDTFLRSKIRFVDDEKDLYFVFALSNLGPAFWILAFGYVLSSAAFLAEPFFRSLPKLRNCGLA
jgi:hypothetical protein